MKYTKPGFRAALRAILAAVSLMTMLLSTTGPALAVSSTTGRATTPMVTLGTIPDFASGADGEKDMLQFTAGGHVLGFSPEGVIIASGDHMLKTEFISSNIVSPQANSAALAENNAAMASPLGRVTYRNVWDGVTVVYDASPGSILESTYYIDEAERVGSVHLGYNRPLSIDRQGNLVIAFESGNMAESAPIAWQEIDGKRMPVTVAYTLYEDSEVGFNIGDHVPGIPVVVDPTLTWNTFLGGVNGDNGNAIAVDGSGNVYVAGYSSATWGSPRREFKGGNDAFAAMLDSSGNLIWNTFLGAVGYDMGRAIAVDGSGNIYVTGYSDATWGAPMRFYQGSNDAFVASCNSTGYLVWNTFLGSNDSDDGYAIAADGSGNVYVAGYSYATWGSPKRGYLASKDAFAAKLNSTSGVLTWNTFLGGLGVDYGPAITVDASTNVYVAGYSTQTWGSPLQSFAGGSNDAFVARLDSLGALTWNTFLGGSGDDQGKAITIDGRGNVYVAGHSDATWGSPVRSYQGSTDAFAAMINPSGTLTWNTFLGGSSGSDVGWGIAADNITGNIYVAGTSNAGWGSPWRHYSMSNDAFVASCNGTGYLTWNTFLGSGMDDQGYAIAVDNITGNIYVAGYSNETWGSPVLPRQGSTDAFAAKITVASPEKAITAFSFQGLSPAVVGTVTEISHTVALSVPFGTALSALVATFTSTGASVTVDGTPQVSGTTANDFSSPVTYRVTAADASTQDYVVTVTSYAVKPTVSTGSATSIMATTAILHGNLDSTGGAATTVSIFSGTDDGVWSRSDNFTVASTGPFSLGVTGLSPGTTYHYRCYAKNSYGGDWSPSSASFATQTALGLWRNYWAGPGRDWFWFSSGNP